MKIAAFTISYSNLSESFVRRELEGLQARGYEVVAFTKRDPDLVNRVPSSVEAREWNDANLRAFKPDLIYASLGTPAHVRAIEAAQWLRIPYVLKVWSGYDAFCNPSPGVYRTATSDPRCRAVVVEDSFMADYAAREMMCAGPKVAIIPNGVDTDVFKPAPIPHDKVRVLSISRWVGKKGLRHAAAAFRALRPANAEFVLIGYGPEEDQLRAEAGINTGVSFHPPITHDELPAAYNAADIFIAPCVVMKGGDADNVPTTVIESLAAGVPVIASDLYAMPLYVEHGVSGLLTKPGDEAAIADALDTLITDTDLRHRLGAQARRAAVECFSLSASLDKLEAILA